MACGMPIIASAEGETEKVITEAKCGISTPLGDSVKLADAIISIKNTDLSILRENSRKYFLSHFEKKHLMDEIELYFN